jgi:small subunit ribosomal protein S16
MVKIRLRRTGKTKQPSYRVVVADSRSPRDGKFIEIIGHYNPIRQPKVLEINGDRARYWLGVGAQPTETVVSLLKRVSVLDESGKVTATPAAEA